MERQFRNLFERANRSKGVTGEVLLQLCESRLDNVVYRMGVATSRRGARQLVSHRHITVNGEIVNIPSYTLKAGDVVGVREKSKSLEVIENALAANSAVTSGSHGILRKKKVLFVSIPSTYSDS